MKNGKKGVALAPISSFAYVSGILPSCAQLYLAEFPSSPPTGREIPLPGFVVSFAESMEFVDSVGLMGSTLLPEMTYNVSGI